MKQFTIKEVSKFGWSVIDPNGNIYTEQPHTKVDAQIICDDLNYSLADNTMLNIWNLIHPQPNQ